MNQLGQNCQFCTENCKEHINLNSKNQEHIEYINCVSLLCPEIEIGWTQATICEKCMESLEIISKFRQQCLEVKNLLSGAVRKSTKFDILKSKVKVAKNQNNFICNYCELDCNNESDLREHLMSHEILKYNCSNCQKSFRTKTKLRIHETSHNNVRNFLCEDCGKDFKVQTALQKHRQVAHSQLLKYECLECDIKFSRSDYLVSHVRKKHSGRTDWKTFVCSECGLRFTSNENLRNHTARVHSSERPFKCQSCQKHFPTVSILKQHCFKVHNEVTCSICKLIFRNKSAYNKHCKTHDLE